MVRQTKRQAGSDISQGEVLRKIRADIDNKITPVIGELGGKLDSFMDTAARAEGRQQEFERVVKKRLKNVEGGIADHEGAIGELTGTIKTFNSLLKDFLPLLSKEPAGIVDKVSVRLSLVIILVSVLGVVLLGAGLSSDDIKAIRDIVVK